MYVAKNKAAFRISRYIFGLVFYSSLQLEKRNLEVIIYPFFSFIKKKLFDILFFHFQSQNQHVHSINFLQNQPKQFLRIIEQKYWMQSAYVFIAKYDFITKCNDFLLQRTQKKDAKPTKF